MLFYKPCGGGWLYTDCPGVGKIPPPIDDIGGGGIVALLGPLYGGGPLYEGVNFGRNGKSIRFGGPFPLLS